MYALLILYLSIPVIFAFITTNIVTKNRDATDNAVSISTDQRVFKSYRARNMYVFLLYIYVDCDDCLNRWISKCAWYHRRVRVLMRWYENVENLGWNSQSSLYVVFCESRKDQIIRYFSLEKCEKSCALYILTNIF